MTRQPLTKAEREELRRLNDAASPAPWFVFKMDGYPNVVSYTVPHNGETLRGEIPADDADDELIAAARNALPRLLADLDAAEAERDQWKEAAKTHLAGKVDAWSQRDRAESELDVERKLRVAAEEHTAMEMADLADVERMAWEAFGKPDGTHETSNVQRLCEAFAAMQSAIAHAAAQFDVSDEKRAEDAPISAEVHFREAVRTIARTLPSSTRAVDRGAIWGELREMDRLHADNAKLSADLAETKAKLAALTGVVLRMRNDMGPIVFGEDIDTVEDAIAAARGGAS